MNTKLSESVFGGLLDKEFNEYWETITSKFASKLEDMNIRDIKDCYKQIFEKGFEYGYQKRDMYADGWDWNG